jgi:hypothetical protein
MVVKPFILEPEQHRDIGRIDGIQPHGEPPAPVADGIGPQQVALAAQHLGPGFGDQGGQDGGFDPVIQTVPHRADAEQGQGEQPEQAGCAGHSATVIRPASVRARICGRYISSTEAAG